MKIQWLAGMAVALVTAAYPVCGEVVAHWRFEAGPAGANVAHTAAVGSFSADVADSSGSGNHLSTWSMGGGAGYAYRADLPGSWVPQVGLTNRFSVQNTGGAPAMFTSSNAPIHTIAPAQWTLEASFKPEIGNYRTIVGRDSIGTVTNGNTQLSALYLQLVPGDGLAIKFCDVSGYWHQAISAGGLVQGFAYPNTTQGHWYHVAAVSDGTTLSLYLDDVDAGSGYQLVAQSDLTLSGSPNTALTVGAGSGSDWVAGTWSVGRGLYNGAHTDRAWGLIDEVRISNHAANPNDFLFATPLVITDSGVDSVASAGQFWIEWNSRTGGYYRVAAKTNLLTQGWAPEAVGIPATPPVNTWTTEVQNVRSAFFRVEAEAAPLMLEIDPGVVLNPIATNIYGHFLEHIYHSANGGLWGELVWNRSFEAWPAGAASWSIAGSDLVQSSLATDVRLPLGNTAWTDYEFTLEARKDGGDEGFLIMFRADGDDFYWLNLGGWGNARHQLEKETAGVGRGPVGPALTGSITSGQWYGIRVRCETNHFQVWLNTTNIIDWADVSGAHLSGQVGVATWATQARFRNLVVKNLSGGTLWSGLPALPSGNPPNDWVTYGPVTVAHTADAANSHSAATLSKSSAAEGGLRQTPFRFDVQTYTGSFWVKGSSISGMAVRLKDGDTVLAQTNYAAPTGSWQKYAFQLIPSTQASNDTLEVGFSGSGIAYVDQISLMGQDAIDTGGYRPDLLVAAVDLQPPVIRWPGGCFASAYRWKYGIGLQDDRIVHPVDQWDDRDVNAFGTDEFIQMCHQIGAEPILVLNVGVLSPCAAADRIGPFPSEAELLQDALDWIEYCNGSTNTTWGAVRAANGHPEPYNVKYWEIDNETWSMGSTWYAGRVNTYAPLMRAADPSIKVIAVGSGGYDQNWNQDILNGCATNIDYLSVHWYADPSEWATGPLNYENYLVNLSNRIAASDNPNIQIYNSEWNAQSIDLRTGLFAGGILNVFERQGDVFTMGGPALMYRHLSAPAWNNAFVNFDHTGSFVAPNYVVMKLWRDHYAPWRIQVSGNTGPLNLVATKADDGSSLYVKAINPAGVGKRVLLALPGGVGINNADLQFVTADSLHRENSLAEPYAVQVVAGTAKVSGSMVDVTLPPFSASVVSIHQN